jgi:tryptophanyl-tRNA synthetase
MRNPTLKTEIETKGLGDTIRSASRCTPWGSARTFSRSARSLCRWARTRKRTSRCAATSRSSSTRLYCGVGNRVEPEDHVKAGGRLPDPAAKIGRVARLVGLDGKNKMSKSLNNAIFLYDSAKDVQKKINKITTGRQSPTEPGDPGNILMQYVDAFIGNHDAARAAEIKRRYAAGDNIGDGHVKAELGEAINAMLEPMRVRRAKMEEPGGESIVLDVIKRGLKKGNAVAEETLHLAKQAMKLDFGARMLG